MEIGADVWIKDLYGDEAWLAGVVIGKNKVGDHFMITTQVEYGKEFTFKLDDELNDISDLKLRNNDADDVVENLINLTHLHEPAMLFCLQERYFKSRIYTYTGPILIAVNPFKRVDHLYAPHILEDYYNFGLMRAQGIEVGSPLPPHVYAIADAAYRDMMKVVLHGYGSEKERSRNPNQAISANQSILISGESGAGKTESTKIVLKYLTTVGKNSNTTEDSSVMEKILQSNPILEAFGNARTLRNDNSSRFGKFIELNFSKRGSLIGGSIKTYLLEKVRLPFQQIGERNFHIFYQLFAGASASHKERWKLTFPDEYNYISRGGVYKLQHVDDAVEYSELRKALDTLNFDPELQSCLFDIVVGILNLGEVRFKSFHDGEGEGSTIDFENDRSRDCVQLSCNLLNILPDELHSTLCSRTITVSGENYIKKLTAVQASDARDAMAKIIYSKLFDWIVKTINLSIRVDQVNVRANIGVLDIFGFESFASNSFEQLCINYTNEALQQQFNQYIFKMEQQEYHREKIEWSFIEFPDNKDCLELIEHKLNGILAMIDDECRLPKASDEKLAGRMYKAFGSNPRFSATVPQKRDFKFCINHYAGLVEYSTITFVEKNKDELPKEAANLMQSSKNRLVTMIFSAVDASVIARQEKVANAKGGKLSKSSPGTAPTSVGFQFKEQLSDLMECIYATSPHYIRCLKPNDQNEPDNFNRPRITEQLRYGGVLEAVRVARSGFPVRLTHHEFFVRYRLVLPAFALKNTSLPFFLLENAESKVYKETCERFVAELRNFVNISSKELRPSKKDAQKYLLFCGVHGLSDESIQIGLTKVFLRKSSYDILESIRFKRCTMAATALQSNFRSYRQRVWFQCILAAAALLQRLSRGMLARTVVRNKRRHKSAILVQTNFRQYFWCTRYRAFRWALIKLQAFFRKRIVRTKYLGAQKSRKVTLLQSLLRMRKCRRHFCLVKRMIVRLQNKWRMRKAKRLLKKLRIEAKDLGKLKQSNDILKQEIELLKQKAAEERERLRKDLEQQHQVEAVRSKDTEIADLRVKLEEQLLLLESEKRLKETIERKLNALKETMNAPCLNCEKLKYQIKSQEEIIDRQRIALHSTSNMNKQVDNESKEAQNRKSILEEEVSRLRKLSIEQKVAIDKLQSQLNDRTSKNYLRPSTQDQVVPARRKLNKISEVASDIMESVTFDNLSNNDDDNSDSSHDEGSTIVLETVKSFEKNIDSWKNELRAGIRVHIWENPKFTNVEVMLKLDPTGKVMQFVALNNSKRYFFQGKLEITPLSLSDVEDCIAGAEGRFDGFDTSMLLTLNGSATSGRRVVVVRLNNREERNTVLSKLRAIVSAEKIVSDEKAKRVNNGTITTKNLGHKKVSFEEQIRTKPDAMEGRMLGSQPASSQRATRRLSVRETILEENLASAAGRSIEHHDGAKKFEQSYNVKELLQQLRDEKEQSEKLKMQVLRITNELVEKDEQLAKFKNQESLYEQKLLEKDNLYKQDTMVRLQLGKRLEQVLMDKEDALEQLELLRMQLDSIKSSVK